MGFFSTKIEEGKELPGFLVFCYGVGHFLNDMTGACWFNYLLYYLVTVSDFSTTDAGFIMLAGQVSDGVFNPLVGFLSDRTKTTYGRKKLWLAIGALIVTVTFYFVFSGCGECKHYFRSKGRLVGTIYCSFLTAAFNVGWAAVQVSHLSLVPEITKVESERVRLYSARSASGIAASFGVLALSAIAFKIYGITDNAFWLMSIGVIVIGDIFTIIFLVFVPEKGSASDYDTLTINENSEENSMKSGTRWYQWFKVPMFYQVSLVYTLSRVAINLSQIFMPFYIELYLGFGSGSEVIAIVPIINMGTGFITTFFLKKINKNFGRRSSYLLGVVSFSIGIVLLWIMPKDGAHASGVPIWWLIYVVSFFFGVGQTTLLVTAISMEADLVGNDLKSSAFVYGSISCLEKLGTGAVIINTSKYSTNAIDVRWIEIIVPLGTMALGLLILMSIVHYWRNTKGSESEPLLNKS